MPKQPFLQSLKLQNVRVFSSITIDPLRRLTLLGGLNGMGKTTVLETIFQFMDSFSPVLPLRLAGLKQTATTLEGMHRINEGRRVAEPSIQTFKTKMGIFDATWNWGTQELNVVPTQMVKASDGVSSSNSKQLGYGYELKLDKQLVFKRHYVDQGLNNVLFNQSVGGVAVAFPSTNYLNRLLVSNMVDLSDRYSAIAQRGEKKKFLSIINSLGREFSDIEILHIAGNPVPFLTLDEVMLPISFAGDGVIVVAAVALAIMNCPGGIVLLDEFDSSIHYSKLVSCWALFHALAVEYDTQIIAATHSNESASALFEAVSSDKKNDAIYYRLDQVDGANIATAYDWSEMHEAASEGWEYR